MKHTQILEEIRDITSQTLSTLKVNASGTSVIRLVETAYEGVIIKLDAYLNAEGSGRMNLWQRRITKLRKDD